MTPTVHKAAVVLCLAALLATAPGPAASTRRFLDDDPIIREPDTQDASGVQEWEINLITDLAINLFGRPGDSNPDVRAKNVNTIDEVPDSSWFTNRIVARPITMDEAVLGPLTSDGPAAGPWTVVAQKVQGFAPGFVIRDVRGEMWFVSFDAAGYPEAATGALIVANKIFWTLGYWQVENHLVTVTPGTITIADTAVFRPVSGKKRPMRRSIWTTCSGARIVPGTVRIERWRRARFPAGPSADSGITPHALMIRMTSCRMNIAANCEH